MEVLEAIKQRRSIRQFQRKALPPKVLDNLIEALGWAPSAGNLQSRKSYFVFSEGLKAQLARAALDQDFIAQAPLAVVACADHRISWRYGERGVSLYCLMDVAASLQNLLLAARALDLGSCWIGAFDEDEVRKLLKLPPYLRPVAIVPIGFPAEQPEPPPRVPKEEAVVFVR
ncbi:MAG: nitroreductase family protein [Candidatus Methylomirabilales bacterium]